MNIFLIILSVLWLLDTVFTLVFVHKHGFVMEANPLMRWALYNLGFFGFIVIKFYAFVPLFLLRQHIHNLIFVCLILILIPVVVMGALVAFT